SVRLVAEHAGKAHSCQVDRLEAAVHDELGNGPTDRRGVHQAVTGEAGGDVVVVEPVVPAVEDHVPVQPVLVVQSGPGGYQSQLVGDWDARHQGGPNDFLEVGLVDRQVESAGGLEVHPGRGEARSLGTDRQPGGVLDERVSGEIGGGLDVVVEAPHRLHREI